MSFLVSFVTFLCKSNSIYFCSSCNYRVCCTVIITFFNFYQCLKTNFHAFLFSFQDNRCKLKLYKLKLLELSYHIRLENHHGMNCYLWGSRHGAVVRVLSSYQCVPGSIPGPSVICGLSLLLVLFSAQCPGFPLTSKTNISKFQF